ncbi:hypothetical protein EVAR_61617_1 [Eumeta japonica]|uniref:RNA-directed DNA polymerase from mobile element jockey n=1 Tax=Eumeta variegata TaxID=151549 RepID=A0A4C1ZLB2_EUMVA|nr:hypothetical protein EVAR_61617_1 [Eumeta japonica]
MHPPRSGASETRPLAGESLWDGIYRLIRETERNREDVLLQADSGQVLDPEESVTLLAETLFPDDQVDTNDTHHSKVRRRTGGGSKICRNRSRSVPSDSQQVPIRLEHFLRAWKVTAVKVIPKDPYIRPKSYCPMDLFPVLGKTVESMLIGSLQWHLMLKLQATQYGFTPQWGTEDALYDLITYIYKKLNLKKAFADDVVLTFFGQSAMSVKEDANRALVHMHSLGVINKLWFKLSKTTLMMLTKNENLTIDWKPMFTPRVTKVCKRRKYIQRLSQSGQSDIGFISGDCKDDIYIAVIEPIVLYVSCAWAPATRKLGVQKMLNAVHSSVAIKAYRAHCSLPPLRADPLEAASYRNKSDRSDLAVRDEARDLRDIFLDRELEKSVCFGDLFYPVHVPVIAYMSV